MGLWLVILPMLGSSLGIIEGRMENRMKLPSKMSFNGFPWYPISGLLLYCWKWDSAISKIHEERFANYRFRIPSQIANANDKNWTYAQYAPKKKLQSNFPSSKINPPAFSPWGVKPPAFTRPGWTTPGAAGAAAAAGVAGAAFTVAEAREAPGNRFSGMVVMPLVI